MDPGYDDYDDMGPPGMGPPGMGPPGMGPPGMGPPGMGGMGGGMGGPPGMMGGPPGMGMGPPGGMGMDPYGDPGYGDPMMGGMGPGGGGAGGGASLFSWLMGLRKMLSVITIIAVVVLEAAISIQNAQLKNLASILQAKNTFRKRELVQTGFTLAAKANEKTTASATSCGYFKGFDVPASTAGKGRSVVYHMATAVAILGLLWCEWPAGPQAAELLQCSRWVMPPLGKIGLFTFAVLQMWLASSTINHYVGTVSYICGWLMLLSAMFGFVFSLCWMGKLKAGGQAAAGGAMGGGMGGLDDGMDDMMDGGPGGMGPPGMGPPGGDMMDDYGPEEPY